MRIYVLSLVAIAALIQIFGFNKISFAAAMDISELKFDTQLDIAFEALNDPTHEPSYAPTYAPSLAPSFAPTFVPTNPTGNSFLTTQTFNNVTVSTLSSTNGTLALKIAILTSLNDSTITLDQISILNFTATPSGSGVVTNYRVFFRSNTPKATYDKLTASLSSAITSGAFTTTLRNEAQQLNVPSMSDVNTTQSNNGPLETASPPTIAPSFIPSKPVCKYPSNKPVYKYPSKKPVYKYPSNKPVYKYPSNKPVYKYPSSKPVYKYPSSKPVYKYPLSKPLYKYPSNNPIEYKKPSSKPVYHYPSSKPVHKYPTKKPTRKPSDHNNQNIGDAATGGATTQESGSLSVGAYAGIALAGLVLLGLLIYASIWYMRKSQTKNKIVSLSEGIIMTAGDTSAD